MYQELMKSRLFIVNFEIALSMFCLRAGGWICCSRRGKLVAPVDCIVGGTVSRQSLWGYVLLFIA